MRSNRNPADAGTDDYDFDVGSQTAVLAERSVSAWLRHEAPPQPKMPTVIRGLRNGLLLSAALWAAIGAAILGALELFA